MALRHFFLYDVVVKSCLKTISHTVHSSNRCKYTCCWSYTDLDCFLQRFKEELCPDEGLIHRMGGVPRIRNTNSSQVNQAIKTIKNRARQDRDDLRSVHSRPLQNTPCWFLPRQGAWVCNGDGLIAFGSSKPFPENGGSHPISSHSCPLGLCIWEGF